ncbi:MAG: flavin reductase [Candidatus Thorarchaeota archaeon]|nr:MAG: flavin reductase family protein [Candidatus Thorarchaeota archaeon]RLI59736.1 MAG: flavin reductase family protein [Candidatus Thorarchaeota archaeon]
MKREINPTTAVVPCPVVLLSVGTDRPNIITLSWVANVCSDPPTIVAGIRPQRYSYDLVKQAGEFVLNIPSVDQLEASRFSGTKSGRSHDKFSECGLTPVPASKVGAMMIEECPINIECRTTQVVHLGVHDLFIAEVVNVHIDEGLLDENGKLDASRTRLFTYLPLNGEYWTIEKRMD